MQRGRKQREYTQKTNVHTQNERGKKTQVN